ncbi:NUDIX domain-containing protein [Streptomyces canus]|uniref:NUDIX hydrolase n=1 Tax=Streptomyces canus TaxID=58343 RepID=UPI002253A4FE|nr:NUDIX domain-containing protein [Streptomyces canus]MCX5254263.1 NUDIX domain-containing protein [Streptomyces canus]
MSEHVTESDDGSLVVAAAVIIRSGRLLVVSKTAAPDVFYLPGGKPDPGEDLETALLRELREELGLVPVAFSPLQEVRALAALERIPMTMTVYDTTITDLPRPAAELSAMRWITGHEPDLTLAPAVRDHVLPLLRSRGLLD